MSKLLNDLLQVGLYIDVRNGDDAIIVNVETPGNGGVIKITQENGKTLVSITGGSERIKLILGEEYKFPPKFILRSRTEDKYWRKRCGWVDQWDDPTEFSEEEKEEFEKFPLDGEWQQIK